jgi:multidrug efflux system membrane fusion protein
MLVDCFYGNHILLFSSVINMTLRNLLVSEKNDGKAKLGWLLSFLVIAILCITFYLFSETRKHNIASEDAVVQADVVHISSAIPGKISEILVHEGARVKRGDVLFRLERDVYELRVKQTHAELAIAEAALHTRGRAVNAESANAVIAKEQITRAQTNLSLAKRTVERLQPLVAKGYATKQELDIATTAERDAQISLSQAASQMQAAQQLVGKVDAAQAAVQVSQVAVAIAEKALQDTEIHAPHDGLVVGLRVATGERLAPGQSLFTLIDSQRWYAQALYLETELADIPMGACASVYVLGSPKRELQGKVINVGWGVNDVDVVNLPMSLPYVQKSLNWVRVAQRFPVRILLENPPQELMRMGASATVTVRTDQSCK